MADDAFLDCQCKAQLPGRADPFTPLKRPFIRLILEIIGPTSPSWNPIAQYSRIVLRQLQRRCLLLRRVMVPDAPRGSSDWITRLVTPGCRHPKPSTRNPTSGPHRPCLVKGAQAPCKCTGNFEDYRSTRSPSCPSADITQVHGAPDKASWGFRTGVFEWLG